MKESRGVGGGGVLVGYKSGILVDEAPLFLTVKVSFWDALEDSITKTLLFPF